MRGGGKGGSQSGRERAAAAAGDGNERGATCGMRGSTAAKDVAGGDVTIRVGAVQDMTAQHGETRRPDADDAGPDAAASRGRLGRLGRNGPESGAARRTRP